MDSIFISSQGGPSGGSRYKQPHYVEEEWDFSMIDVQDFPGSHKKDSAGEAEEEYSAAKSTDWV